MIQELRKRKEWKSNYRKNIIKDTEADEMKNHWAKDNIITSAERAEKFSQKSEEFLKRKGINLVRVSNASLLRRNTLQFVWLMKIMMLQRYFRSLEDDQTDIQSDLYPRRFRWKCE